MPTSRRVSPRIVNRSEGVTLPVDNQPLPGVASSKRKRRVTVNTPEAVDAAAETPVVAALDFTFKNAWLARVAQGLSREEIVDLAAGAEWAYGNARDAGVSLPVIPGGFAELTLANFGLVVQTLDSWADLGKWDHTSDKPDLPDEYPANPSLQEALKALTCGIERLEIVHNKSLPTKSRAKVVLTKSIILKLGGKFKDADQFSQDVLGEISQGDRIWVSDGGTATPFRLEFYLRSKQITQPILKEVFDMVSSPLWRDFYSKCEGTVAQAVWIISNAVTKAREATAAEVSRRQLLAAANAKKAASDFLATQAATGAGATDARKQAARNKAAAADAMDLDGGDGESEGGRSVLSAAESMRSALTDATVRSVLSDVESLKSSRSALSDVASVMDGGAAIRASAEKVLMKDVLDLQKAQFGLPGQTMSLSEANAAAECNHGCWVYKGNFVIDIRHGSTVWLKPVASRWEDGSPWWTCVQVGNPGAPPEQWNALQMVWGMEAYRKENEGSLVHPEDVEKRAKAELSRLSSEPAADAGEGLSGKTFTATQRALFKRLNSLAQKGIDDSSGDFMRNVGFDKLDSGEAVVLLHTLGYLTESQFKQVLPTLEFLLERYLRGYNPDRGGLAVRPFQAVVVLYCEWSRMVPIRNGHVPVCTMATFTAEPESEQLVPTPLAGESSSATKQTMVIDNGELVVQGPQGATTIVRPPITEAAQVWLAMANIKALLHAVHPPLFAVQTLLSVEFMCTRAVARDSASGVFEASLVLAQCFLWLGSSVARHLRLVGSVDGFAFMLTPSQTQTIETQRARNEVQTLQVQLRQVTASVDQRMSQLQASMRASPQQTQVQNPHNPPGSGRKAQRRAEAAARWAASNGAPSPAPATVPAPAPAPFKTKVTFNNPTGKGGKGKGGKGKGKGKGGKGKGKGGGSVSQAASAALDQVFGAGKNYFDERANWIAQWTDPTEEKTHCFMTEKLGIACDSAVCPACN